MKFSVICICKNQIGRMGLTLDSVLQQTYKNFELIVVDGNSTDGTLELVHSKYRGHLQHFIEGSDQGIYPAQNAGASVATGDYLLFLNGGDLLASPEVFEKVNDWIRQNGERDLLSGDMWIEDSNNTRVLGQSPEQLTAFHLYRSTVWHPVTFIRRSFYSRVGPYSENYRLAGDYDFFLKAAIGEKCSYGHLPFAVCVFRTDGVGSLPQNQQQMRSERRLAQKRFYSYSERLLYFLCNQVYRFAFFRGLYRMLKALQMRS